MAERLVKRYSFGEGTRGMRPRSASPISAAIWSSAYIRCDMVVVEEPFRLRREDLRRRGGRGLAAVQNVSTRQKQPVIDLNGT